MNIVICAECHNHINDYRVELCEMLNGGPYELKRVATAVKHNEPCHFCKDIKTDARRFDAVIQYDYDEWDGTDENLI